MFQQVKKLDLNIKIHFQKIHELICNKIEINLSQFDDHNVRSILNYVDTQFPGFKEKIFNTSGELKQFVNIFINGEDARYLDGVETEVNSADEISIVPAVAGGIIQKILTL